MWISPTKFANVLPPGVPVKAEKEPGKIAVDWSSPTIEGPSNKHKSSEKNPKENNRKP